MRPGPLATITRRITSMWHDPEMRSALAYIALRPHRWSFRRPALIAKRPDYLRALPAGPGTAALPVIDPLLAWGDRPMQCEEFDLRLASHTMTGARLEALPWASRFNDLEDEASLHRFAWLPPWLLDRRAEGARADEVLRLLRAAQRSWIAWHPHPDRSEAWQVYTVSERLMNWIIGLLAVGARPAGDPVADSMSQQARHLLENVEYYGDDLTGNHFSNNGRALYATGFVLGDPALREAGKAILLRERERLLDHRGFLREDSSHYQFLVGRNYTEVLWFALQDDDDEFSGEIRRTVRALSDACRFFLVPQPNGVTIPLIGDISPDCPPQWLLGVPWVASSLSGAAAPAGDPPPGTWSDLFLDGLKWDPHAGGASPGVVIEREWARLKHGGWTVFVHVNRLGSPFQPGHAHNDTGGLVAFFAGEPLVIEAGRRTYENNELGRFGAECWSHSLLAVDGRNPAPSRSWMVRGASDRDRLRPRIESGGAALIIRHGGFSRLRGVGEHRRSIQVDARGDLVIEDVLEGEGEHRLSLIFHLKHAVASAQEIRFRTGETSGVLLLPEDLSAVRFWSGPDMTEREGWGTPAYGEREPIVTLMAEAVRPLPWRGVSRIQLRGGGV